jgi:hypothetical protein
MRASLLGAGLAVLLLPACAEQPALPLPSAEQPALQALECTASVRDLTVSCGAPRSGAHRTIIGGQNVYLKLTSSNISYVGNVFQFNVTVQNLLNEAIGTPDGSTVDPNGIRVFFHDGPDEVGTGTATVANADSNATFTASAQPYFQYSGILAKNQVSAAKTWQINVPPTVTSFTFQLYISTTVQPLVVINEIMANPGGVVQDSVGEYVEVYNAGTLAVDLQGFKVSDNTGVIESTPHTIASSLVIPPGAYRLLGRSQNTAVNGAIAVDYVYVASTTITQFQLSNSAGDVFRLKAPNNVVIDSVGYTSAATSAAANTARQLSHPSLGNANTDASPWAAATAFYETTNKGTPRAQNTNFSPP